MFVARIQDAHLPPNPPLEKPPITDIVTAVAAKVLKEFALAIGFGAIVACFIATPSGLMFMMSASIVQLAVSSFFHALGAYASYKALDKDQSHYEKMASFCEWITGTNFGIFTGFNTQTVIHESGHALASMLIYKRPRPLIEVHPFVGGQTQFYKTALTPLGQKLGPAASTCFVVAAGPGLTLLVSAVLLAIGIALLDHDPEVGKYLIAWSGIDFIHHAIYAYSALGAEQWNLSHDFVHLSIFGLHPIVASIGILAIPVIISLAMYWGNGPPTEIPAAPYL